MVSYLLIDTKLAIYQKISTTGAAYRHAILPSITKNVELLGYSI
jgi:hypothetical protein